PQDTKKIKFPGMPLPSLWIQLGARAHYQAKVSPFGDRGIKGWSAAPPRLSQPPTSFVGSWRQGIHRVLLFSGSKRTLCVSLWSFQGAAGRSAQEKTAPQDGLSKLSSDCLLRGRRNSRRPGC